MSFKNQTDFSHKQPEKIGILICNLGSPAAPTRSALRRYLKQFLSDPRVVEFPRALWWLVLNGIILNFRPQRSAKAYASVWQDDGAPLLSISAKQADKLRATFEREHPGQIELAWAMRYGQPSIESALDTLCDSGVTRLIVLPLYPQYSASTTASTFDALAEDFRARRYLPELRFVNSYHDKTEYIEALAQSVESHWQTHGRADKLIFSYHGIPLRYLHKGDPYHCHCLKTSRLLQQRLGLNDEECMTAFQSRFGREAWLKPYTDHSIEALAKQGVKSLQVVCPGFSADCLETIEEIDVENRDIFLNSGGERFEYIPALNDNDNHIDALYTLTKNKIEDWLKADTDQKDLEQRHARFEKCPHNRAS